MCFPSAIFHRVTLKAGYAEITAAHICTVVFIEFAATAFAYLAPDFLRQQLMTDTELLGRPPGSFTSSVEDFKRYVLGRWSCFSFLKMFHLSSKGLLQF